MSEGTVYYSRVGREATLPYPTENHQLNYIIKKFEIHFKFDILIYKIKIFIFLFFENLKNGINLVFIFFFIKKKKRGINLAFSG